MSTCAVRRNNHNTNNIIIIIIVIYDRARGGNGWWRVTVRNVFGAFPSSATTTTIIHTATAATGHRPKPAAAPRATDVGRRESRLCAFPRRPRAGEPSGYRHYATAATPVVHDYIYAFRARARNTHTIITIIIIITISYCRGRVPARGRPSRTHKLRALFKHPTRGEVMAGREGGTATRPVVAAAAAT